MKFQNEPSKIRERHEFVKPT